MHIKRTKDLYILHGIVLTAASIVLLTGCGYAGGSRGAGPEHVNVREGHTMADGVESETEEDKQKEDIGITDAPDDIGSIDPGSGAGPGEDRGESSLLDPEGSTLAARITEPEGYSRTAAEAGSLLEFLREYPMKEAGSPVLLYDGTLKSSQDDHVAVFKLPIEQEDLQQCADSVIRVYAEYFWHTGQYERIAFHFTNGFYAEYTKWRDGYRIQPDGNDIVWTSSAGYDDTYENFKKYLRIVFSYAGTMSMDAESEEISPGQIQAGDIFLKGGSPGHVVMVVDICKNAQEKKAFLLAQGYMPAQEFHVLKNPMHENDPWYYEEETEFPFITPEYTFEEGSLRRVSY